MKIIQGLKGSKQEALGLNSGDYQLFHPTSTPNIKFSKKESGHELMNKIL